MREKCCFNSKQYTEALTGNKKLIRQKALTLAVPPPDKYNSELFMSDILNSGSQ